jgi:hypothetical protein
LNSEEDENFEDDEREIINLKKPVFVSRRERDKLSKLQEEHIRLKEENEKNLNRKKFENKMLLLQTI